MTTTTVDTQALVAGSGGTSTPVKLTLQSGTMAVSLQMSITATRAATPGQPDVGTRKNFTMFWAYSPDDLTLANVPTLLRHCAKSQSIILNKDIEAAGQRIQARSKVDGQYLYVWFEYPTSPDAYSVVLKTTELFILSDPVNPAFNSVTVSQTALGTTTTDGVVIQNTTASTAGVPVQYSPRVLFRGHAWNTTATAADNYLDFMTELRPVSAATPSSTLVWASRRSTAGTGAFVDAMSLTSDGILTTVGAIVAAGTLTAQGTGVSSFAGRIDYNGASAGEFRFNSSSVGSQTDTISSYYNTGGAFAPLNITGGTTTLYVAGAAVLVVSPTGIAVTGQGTFSGSVAFAGATISATTAAICPAGTTGVSSLRIPHGVAPTSPVNGDVWSTTTTLNFRLNGVTKSITMT